jgi:hypothetical protein
MESSRLAGPMTSLLMVMAIVVGLYLILRRPLACYDLDSDASGGDDSGCDGGDGE